jgi:hypothetical protein
MHLEFFVDGYAGYLLPRMDDDAKTVLLLPGDIHTGLKAREFLIEMCGRFELVVYTLGNHEFYHTDVARCRADWRAVEMPENFVLLDDDEYIYKGVRLLGGTLWTDFDKQNYWAMTRARNNMNDYDLIEFVEGDRKRKLLPIDTTRLHKKTMDFFTERLAQPFDGPTVIATHHLPHPLCVPERYRNDELNAAYVTNLDNFIYDNEIAAWVHGHTHDNVDFTIHGTRIMCNPRGYHPYAINKDFNHRFTFEV